MSYIGNGPGNASQRVTTTATALNAQTEFLCQSGYLLGYVDVFSKGKKLVHGVDFQANNGTSITLTTPATAGDIVELISYIPRGLSDGYTKAEADAKYLLIGTSYTKAEADAKYPLIGTSYTKAEADAKYPLIGASYTKVETDARYPLIGASYTKAETDSRYTPIGTSYTKAETDAKYPILDGSGNLNITGSLKMSNRPAFRVSGSGSTAIPTGTTLTSSNWNLDYQQGTGLNTSTGVFTAPVAGLYLITALIRTSSNTNSGINQIIVMKTPAAGGGTIPQIMIEFGTNTSMNHAGGSTITRLAVGDTLHFGVTAGTINFDGNDSWSVAYIG